MPKRKREKYHSRPSRKAKKSKRTTRRSCKNFCEICHSFWKMSDRFSYPGDSSIIIQDGSIIWNDQSHDQASLQYMDANDTIINDSTINESYVTATDSNETQYFSILEHSNDISLEDLHNLTVGNADIQENIVLSENDSPAVDAETPQESKDDDESAQVVVFTVDGSNDLYGLQFTQDEEGNIQKYQFKFRTTAEGQLEAIPETVQLLPNDDEATAETEGGQAESEPVGELQATQSQQFFLIQTDVDSQTVNNNLDLEEQQVETSDINLAQGHVLIKSDGLEAGTLETSVEADNFDQVAQHDCTDFVQQEDPTEIMEPEHINIKTEIVEGLVLEENNSPITANIKREHFTEELDDPEEFDETIRPDEDNLEEVEQINVIKQQPQDNLSEVEIENYQNEEQVENFRETVSEESQEEEIDDAVQNQLNHEELVQQFIHENCQIEVEYEEEQTRSSQEYLVYSVEETQKAYDNNCMDEPNINADHNSDSEQYEIVEGLHITGEINDGSQKQLVEQGGSEPILHEVIERYQEQNIERTNILKHPTINANKNQKAKKPFVSVKYYVVYPEKENVNSLAENTTSQLSVPKLTRANPRSVLRTSFMKSKPSGQYEKMAVDPFPESDLFHKRFAKNKDAMRAKLFHNSLNRTTIPQAPVRQQRQPRKQEIKPVTERSDEEIIVQEVMVSSNGFIESLNRKMKNKLQVTAVVELSDSEDDCNTIINKNRRKTHHIPRQTSESELSVIEIHSDEEIDLPKENNLASIEKRGKGRPKKSNTESKTTTLKRRRGRPPKKNKLPFEEVPLDCELSPSKHNHMHSEVTLGKEITVDRSEINIEKEEIACPKCPKTFPSKNSLNTHIYHHNLETRLKTKAIMNSQTTKLSQSTLTKLEYTHKCQTCQQTFKNSILLQKHNCTQKQNLLNCSVCLKQFRDVSLLNIHKKSHIKANLVSNTSIVRISPKKSLLRPSTSLLKIPKTKTMKTVATNVFKCKQCSKVCNSEQSLVAHKKLHQKFLCSSCLAPFSSKLLLDTHIRTNCVKVKSPANKRLSLRIRKSFIHTPPKRLSVCKPQTSCNTTLNQSVTSLKMECEICDMKFSTFRSLYTHKVQKHGLNTPDKNLLHNPKPTLYKPKAAHGGIPANDRMKRAYAALRQKLAEMQDTSNFAQ